LRDRHGHRVSAGRPRLRAGLRPVRGQVRVVLLLIAGSGLRCGREGVSGVRHTMIMDTLASAPQAPVGIESYGSRAGGTGCPGVGAGAEQRPAVAAGRAAWGWHGAVRGIVRRPARLAGHRLDRRGGVAFGGGADRGDLVARLLPDLGSRAFSRFVDGVDLGPRPVPDAGRLAVSQVKDPPRLPQRVGVPEPPGLLRVPGLWWMTVVVRCVTSLRVTVRRVPIVKVTLGRIAIRGVAVREISLP
jgi:hypothetical protein